MYHQQTPVFSSLTDLFTSIGPYDNTIPRDSLPTMGDNEDSGRIGRYLYRSHGSHQAYSAVPTDGLIQWCRENMFDINNDTISFHFIVWRWTDDGKMSADGRGSVAQVNVYAKYSVIIGSRLLASVGETEFAALGVKIA